MFFHRADILSVVMNMRQDEAIKTNLYVLLAVLVVAAAALTAALAVDKSRGPGSGSGQAQPSEIVHAADSPGDVSDAPLQPEESGADIPTQTVDATAKPGQASAETTTYALRTRDGCLQVYILETGEFYMETSIVYRLLPESVQTDIDRGKYFESEEELLEFLESYSS